MAYLVTTEGAKLLIGVPAVELADATGRFAELLGGAYKDKRQPRHGYQPAFLRSVHSIAPAMPDNCPDTILLYPDH